MQTLDRAIDERTGLDITYRIVRPDGSVRYAQSVGRPILNAAGEVEELVGVVMDVTDRKRAARALRRARERALTARFAAMLDERARVAREIHDSLLQGVTGIALQLRAMLPHVTPADTLHRIVELADRTSHEARRAIWDLRSPSIADDIIGALEDAARRHLAGTSLAYRVTVTGRPRALSPSAIPVAVRIMEEGLTNVVKHASATSIWLTVAYERRLVRITLADDGHGFDVAGAREGHWGIVGMHERADEIGGRLHFRSTPETGTEIVLEISRRGV
jgi:signal transduction histidine kinase